MVNWWPFARNQKQSPQPPARSAPYTPTLPVQVGRPDSGFLSGNKAYNTIAKPPTQESPFVERYTSPHVVAQNASSRSAVSLAPPQTPARRLRPLILDTGIASPMRLGIGNSPHLRPVPESELNRSSSLRTPKSAKESVIRRSLSSRRRKEDRDLEKHLQSPISRASISERIAEKPGPLSRAGSKRKRLTIDPTTSGLPSQSTQSIMTTATDTARFDVGSLAIFSPHPQIRLSSQLPRQSNLSLAQSGVSTRPYSKHTLQQSKTVDELANNLGASELRQLMERDQRRKQRKRRAEEERASQRLEQLAAREDRQRYATDSKPSLISYDTPAEAGPSRITPQRLSADLYKTRGPKLQIATDRPENPFADPEYRTASPTAQILGATSKIKSPFDDPEIRTAKSVRYSQATISPPGSPRQHARNASGLSQLVDPRNASFPDLLGPPQNTKRSSGGSARYGPFSSLFRKNNSGHLGTEERSGSVKSEGGFSNLSRDSMSRQLPPSHLRDIRPSSPKTPTPATFRAKSRFIEDLPELPSSAVESIAQPFRASSDAGEGRSAPMPILNERAASASSDRDKSRNDSLDPETSMAAAAVLSQSLGSVGSEASWLSGKSPDRRVRGPPTPKRGSERVSIDEALGRESETYARIPIPEKNPARSRLSGIRSALAAEEQRAEPVLMPSIVDEQISHGEVKRQNTVLHISPRIRSAEASLNHSSHEQPESPLRNRPSIDTANSDYSNADLPETPFIQDAHARHLSTGSARLLNVPARQDSQRSSISYTPTPSRVSMLPQN